MKVNLQRFTRTWPSATAGTVEGEEVEEYDELGDKIIIITINLYYDYYNNNTKNIY